MASDSEDGFLCGLPRLSLAPRCRDRRRDTRRLVALAAAAGHARDRLRAGRLRGALPRTRAGGPVPRQPRGLRQPAIEIPVGDDEAVILPAAEVTEAEPEPQAEPELELEPEAPVHASVDDLAPSEVTTEDIMEAPAEQAEEAATALPGDDGHCHWCRETLPVRENLNFCPYCGTDMGVVPCGSCGEAVEPGWRFCIQCGAASGEV